MQGFSERSTLGELAAAAEPRLLEQTQRLIADPERRLRSEELLELAQEQDPTFVARLIADFPKWGLLAFADTEGRHAGEGVGRYWPAAHAVTFIQVVRKRAQGTRRRSDLVNLPVLSWLMGGDQLVPLEQARRAVTTWARASQKLSGRRRASDVRRTVLRYPQVQQLIDAGKLTETEITSKTLAALRAGNNRDLAEVITSATHPERESDATQDEAEVAKHEQALDLIAAGARALPNVSNELLLSSRARYHALHHELFKAISDGCLDADGVQRFQDEAIYPCANLVHMIGAELEASAGNETAARVFGASAEAGWQIGLHMQALAGERERLANDKRRRRERIKARRR